MTQDDITGRPARVCDCTDLKVGDVVHDEFGNQWVFIGYTVRTTGRCAEFVRSVEGMATGMSSAWQYHVDFIHTALRKFPDLASHVTGKMTID